MVLAFVVVAIGFRHCEERSDEAIQLSCYGEGSWIASLRSQ
jgi:hypothetical protein